MLWGLANGRAAAVVHLITGPMKTDMAKEQHAVPPPAQPDFKALPPPTVVTPDFVIAPPTISAITENASKKAASAAPVVTVPARSHPRRPVMRDRQGRYGGNQEEQRLRSPRAIPPETKRYETGV